MTWIFGSRTREHQIHGTVSSHYKEFQCSNSQQVTNKRSAHSYLILGGSAIAELPFYDHVPKLMEITRFDIEDSFNWIYDCGLKGSTADKHYTIFKLSFARAVRKKIIKKMNNPMKEVPKPKIETYIADYYKPSELKILFDIVKDDIIEVPVFICWYIWIKEQ